MKASKIAGVVVLVGAVGALGWFIHRQMSIREIRNRHSEIIERHFNEHDYRTAARKLQELRAEAEGQRREKITADLVECYLRIGDDPGTPLAEAAERYARAEQLDPEALSDEQRRRMEVGLRAGRLRGKDPNG